jgi:hypothetical protein
MNASIDPADVHEPGVWTFSLAASRTSDPGCPTSVTKRFGAPFFVELNTARRPSGVHRGEAAPAS